MAADSTYQPREPGLPLAHTRTFAYTPHKNSPGLRLHQSKQGTSIQLQGEQHLHLLPKNNLHSKGNKHLHCQHREGRVVYTVALSSTHFFFFFLFSFFSSLLKEETPSAIFNASPSALVAAGVCILPKQTSLGVSVSPVCLPAGANGTKGTGEPVQPGRRSRMAALTRWVLCLCLGWGCLCLAPGDVLKARWVELQRRPAPGGVRGGRARAAAGDYGLGQQQDRLQPRDKVSEHMLRLYDQYSGSRGGRAAAPRPQDPSGLPRLHPRQGNTVRGFRPLGAGESRGRAGVGSGVPCG